MSDLYNRIASLCAQKGIKPGRMCDDLGMAKSMISDLKHGRKSTLDVSTLQKFAGYLGVSVGYLATGESAEITDDQLIFGLLNGDTDGFTLEMLEEVKNFAQFVKNRKTP